MTPEQNPPILRWELTELYTRLGELATATQQLAVDMGEIKGELKGKLHEPASCPLRENVSILQQARANSAGFLAGLVFLAGFLASGVTLGISLLFQWLWK